MSQGMALEPRSLVPVVPAGIKSLSWATLPVKVMVSPVALPRVVLPLTERSVVTVADPPVVNSPVPVVMALLVVVFRPKVPVPVMSIMELLAERTVLTSARTVLPAESRVRLPVVVVIELAWLKARFPALVILKRVTPAALAVKMSWAEVSVWLKMATARPLSIDPARLTLAEVEAVAPRLISAVKANGDRAPEFSCQ